MYQKQIELSTRLTLALVLIISTSVYFAEQKAHALVAKERAISRYAVEHRAVIMKAPSKVVLKKMTSKRKAQLANAVKLSDKELVEVLYFAGFRGESLKIAWAISKAESNGRPLAHNGNRKTGDNSFGIFQINMIDNTGTQRRDKFDLEANSALFNPIKNAQIAYHMSNGGRDWSAWSAYKSGAYKLRIKDFPKGV